MKNKVYNEGYDDAWDDLEKETFTRCRCEKCEYEENVPNFVLAEFRDIQKFAGETDIIDGALCPACNGDMFPIKE